MPIFFILAADEGRRLSISLSVADVSTVLCSMDLCRLGHEITGVERVRLGEQRVMGRLRVIAEIIPLGGELVIICGGPMVFCGLQMRLDGWVFGHRMLLALTGRLKKSGEVIVGNPSETPLQRGEFHTLFGSLAKLLGLPPPEIAGHFSSARPAAWDRAQRPSAGPVNPSAAATTGQATYLGPRTDHRTRRRDPQALLGAPA